jgi:hypothetical protein
VSANPISSGIRSIRQKVLNDTFCLTIQGEINAFEEESDKEGESL